ncbi:MAG: hypothetical protein LC754_10325 [Acidobacteria bacterium]|nr:hypothetical protein [Acidobacteriota bacterium]
MSAAQENEIIDAIADVLVAKTTLIPQTKLSEAIPVGAQALPVVDASNFSNRGYVHWFDDTGEHMFPIGSVDYTGNVVNLDFTGYAARGLPIGVQSPHASGAVVATNLMLHKPISISAMLRSQLPVVAIWPRQKDTKEFSVGATIAPMLMRIQVHVALQQFDSAPMDSEAYNELQQRLSRDSLQTVTHILDSNRHLQATYNAPGNHANGLGDGSGVRFAQSMWDTFVEEVDIPQAIGALDVWVRPLRYVR